MDYVKFLNSLDEIALPSGSGPAPAGWNAEKIFKELKEDGMQTVKELEKIHSKMGGLIEIFKKYVGSARSHNWPSTTLLVNMGDSFGELANMVKSSYAFPNGCNDIKASCHKLRQNDDDWKAFTGRKS